MVVIVTKLPDGRTVHGAVRSVHAWAWMHTLRTDNEPENMQQVLEWAQDEMHRANIAPETINAMITDEVNYIMQAYKELPDPKPELEIEMDPEPPEIA